jgi:hypothetical protein
MAVLCQKNKQKMNIKLRYLINTKTIFTSLGKHCILSLLAKKLILYKKY